ncbi:MAG: DUF3102 domain-containing protein, partial [Tetragenococcus koreensis]|nr:DUF3102 domain-containing protein [Tetragenococcus koreensis]
LELSNDLTQITTEIKTYQSIGARAVFEIGRRLKWVKENDLAHGEYLNWLRDSVEINPTTAQRFVKIATELPNEYSGTDLGWKALYEIATMPEEEREKPQQLESGETKKPDEMTVKELRETKQKLKSSEETIERQSKMIDDLNEREPETIEKEITVERVPDDYHFYKSNYKDYKKQNEQLRSEMKQLEKLQQESNRDANADRKQEEELQRLQREADINVYKFILSANDFVKEQSVTAYDSGSIASATDETKEKLIESIKRLEKFTKQIKQEIKGEVKWVINN